MATFAGATVPPPPSISEWSPPDLAHAGLLVVHGAGTHAPGTALNEIIAPTLARLADEKNLVSVRPFMIGDASVRGGPFDGLTVDYIPQPLEPDDPVLGEPRRLMIVEARWDSSFVDPDFREVSSWTAVHASRLMWEIAAYQSRGLILLLVAGVILVAIITGLVFAGIDNTGLAVLFLTVGWVIAYIAALGDAGSGWSDRSERYGKTPGASPLWSLVAAASLMVHHVQRAVMIVVALVAMIVLPLFATAVRFIGTIPGFKTVSGGVLDAFERGLIKESPTDAEIISSNPVAAGAVQTRVKSALMEIEQRLLPSAALTVLAHSAGTPIAWWALSEPGIHTRHKTNRVRYRLLTVGGMLNWAKRGMDCTATPLDMPIVASESAAREDRTIWANLYTAWDPAPHGPIRIGEFAGKWETWNKPDATGGRGVVGSWRKRLGWRAPLPPPDPPDEQPDPNLIFRNLGSPISAEHSEYFRNQQEFVPLVVRAIDPDIRWARHDAEDRRHERFANARMALLSPLVRVRMSVYSLPVVALIWGFDDNDFLAGCGKGEGGGFAAFIGKAVKGGINALPDKVPFVDAIDGKRCASAAGLTWSDGVLVLVLALIAYALVEIYTSYCWQNLGRRVHSIDPIYDKYVYQARAIPAHERRDASPRRDERVPRQWWPPSAWRIGRMPLLSALGVWVPTLFSPLLIFTLYWEWSIFVLFGVVIVLAIVESAWFEQCLRGLENPVSYWHTQKALGRNSDVTRWGA